MAIGDFTTYLPQVKSDKLRAQGVEPLADSAQEFAQLIESNVARWRRVVQTAGIKPE